MIAQGRTMPGERDFGEAFNSAHSGAGTDGDLCVNDDVGRANLTHPRRISTNGR